MVPSGPAQQQHTMSASGHSKFQAVCGGLIEQDTPQPRQQHKVLHSWVVCHQRMGCAARLHGKSVLDLSYTARPIGSMVHTGKASDGGGQGGPMAIGEQLSNQSGPTSHPSCDSIVLGSIPIPWCSAPAHSRCTLLLCRRHSSSQTL